VRLRISDLDVFGAFWAVGVCCLCKLSQMRLLVRAVRQSGVRSGSGVARAHETIASRPAPLSRCLSCRLLKRSEDGHKRRKGFRLRPGSRVAPIGAADAVGRATRREGFEPMTVGREDGKTVVGGLWFELVRQRQLRGIYGGHARRRPRMKPFAPFVAKSGRVAGADGSAEVVFVPFDRGGAPRLHQTNGVRTGLRVGPAAARCSRGASPR